MLRSLALPLTLCLSLASCGPPVEIRRRVTSEKAPILPEAEDDERALSILHTGDVVEVLRTLKPLDWKGSIEGVDSRRSGDVLELKRSGGDASAFGFAVDLTEDVKVPTAAWLCERMQGGPNCTARLRRIARGQTIVAYDPCTIGPCRIGVARGRKVHAITLDGLSDLYPATIEGHEVLIATSRWVKTPNWTGATTYVIRVGDTLQRALTIPTEEVDSRAAPTIQRMGTLAIEGGVLVFRGTRRELAPSTGATQYSAPIVETYHIAK